MHLKSLFSSERTKWLPAKWLPERRAFRDFVNRCWNANTGNTSELFRAGLLILLALNRAHKVNITIYELYANAVDTNSAETKSHAS